MSRPLHNSHESMTRQTHVLDRCWHALQQAGLWLHTPTCLATVVAVQDRQHSMRRVSFCKQLRVHRLAGRQAMACPPADPQTRPAPAGSLLT